MAPANFPALMHSSGRKTAIGQALRGHLFARMRQERGRRLHAARAVRVIGDDPHEIGGVVIDNGRFHTAHLMFGGSKGLGTDCNCGGPAFCEHAFALLLRVAEDHETKEAEAGQQMDAGHQQGVAATRRPSATPPPTPSQRRKSLERPRPQRPPQPPTPTPDWRTRMIEVLDGAEQTEGRPAPRVTQRLPCYFVDLETTRATGKLELHVMVQRQQKGAVLLEPFSFNRNPAALPDADRHLFQVLRVADGRSPGLVPRSPSRIDGNWLAIAIPLLFATGRVHLAASMRKRELASTALRLDDGPPFTFASELRRSHDGTAIHGRIHRNGEEHRHPDILAVLEGDFAITGDRMVRLSLGAGLPFARALLQDGPMQAPPADEGELIGNLLIATASCPQLAPPVPTRPAGKPTPVLLVRMQHAMQNHVPVEVQLEYGERRVELNNAPLLQPPEPDGTWLRRDLDLELDALNHCVAVGGEALAETGLPDCFLLPRKGLGALLSAFVDGGVRVLADGKPLRAARTCRVQVTTGIDWFDVHGTVEFEGGASLALPQALATLRAGNRMVELGDGSAAMLPESWLQQWASVFELGAEKDGALRVLRSQALLLDALLAGREQQDLTVDQGFATWRQRLQSFRGIAARKQPKGFRGRLRDYQQTGLGWLHFLRELGLGGCLADDMGLGKTVQVLALLREVHRPDHGGLPSLLVAPRSLIDNWRREAERFTPGLRVLDFTGPDRWQRLGDDAPWQQCDLVLTTYGTLRLDVARFEQEQVQFEYAVLDEAQVASNETSLTSKAVRLLRARHRLALTGTPVQNHTGELWALFEFLNPGLLGKSRTFQRLLAGGSGAARGRGLDLDLLRKALLPFLLRRTKEEVLPELPEKQEQDLVCELEGSQRKTYDALRDGYRARLLHGAGALGAKEKFAALEALLRLRQAACHEALLDPQLGERGSAKLDALLPKLQELAESGHKALVFSQFTQFLAIVRTRLDALGIRYEYLDGGTRKRQECVDRFQQDPGCPLFLISLKAGGFGLNLTAADYVFLLDPWWNPAAETQAIDRAHRIGRTGKVLAYRLIARDTVEEKVLALQAEKKQLAAAVLGADRSLLAKMTREDLAALLG